MAKRRSGIHNKKNKTGGQNKELRTKKINPILKGNATRTKLLNGLASELNGILKYHYKNLDRRNFYHAILSRFRKEPLNNRILLLRQLLEMDLHPDYPLSRFGPPQIKVTHTRSEFVIGLIPHKHPSHKKREINCYYFELLLLQWDRTQEPLMAEHQTSEWIEMTKGRPEFDFTFRRLPKGVHWLLCVKTALGYNKKSIGTLETQGVRIMNVGSFEKKDLELMKEAELRESKSFLLKPEPPEEMVMRVKAKKFVE